MLRVIMWRLQESNAQMCRCVLRFASFLVDLPDLFRSADPENAEVAGDRVLDYIPLHEIK